MVTKQEPSNYRVVDNTMYVHQSSNNKPVLAERVFIGLNDDSHVSSASCAADAYALDQAINVQSGKAANQNVDGAADTDPAAKDNVDTAPADKDTADTSLAAKETLVASSGADNCDMAGASDVAEALVSASEVKENKLSALLCKLCAFDKEYGLGSAEKYDAIDALTITVPEAERMCPEGFSLVHQSFTEAFRS